MNAVIIIWGSFEPETDLELPLLWKQIKRTRRERESLSQGNTQSKKSTNRTKDGVNENETELDKLMVPVTTR